MYKAMITTAAVSDVDYFQSMDEAVAKYPLTFLDDLCVCSGGLQLISRSFVHRAGTYYLSVFDIVASFLCPGLLLHMVEVVPSLWGIRLSACTGSTTVNPS